MVARRVLDPGPFRTFAADRAAWSNRPRWQSMISGAVQLEGRCPWSSGWRVLQSDVAQPVHLGPVGQRNDEPVTDLIGNHRVANCLPDRRPVCRMMWSGRRGTWCWPGTQHQPLSGGCLLDSQSGRGTGVARYRCECHDIPERHCRPMPHDTPSLDRRGRRLEVLDGVADDRPTNSAHDGRSSMMQPTCPGRVHRPRCCPPARPTLSSIGVGRHQHPRPGEIRTVAHRQPITDHRCPASSATSS